MDFNCEYLSASRCALTDPNSLYLIPGSAFPLERVCLGEDNILLIYADRRARLWDVKTKEFWRSMGLDKAEELVAQGGWTDVYVYSLLFIHIVMLHRLTNAGGCLPDTVIKPFSGGSVDCGSLIEISSLYGPLIHCSVHPIS